MRHIMHTIPTTNNANMIPTIRDHVKYSRASVFIGNVGRCVEKRNLS